MKRLAKADRDRMAADREWTLDYDSEGLDCEEREEILEEIEILRHAPVALWDDENGKVRKG